MALDPDREVYPNAPLRFVAFEVRFPASPALAADEVRRKLFDALRETFPISQSAPASVEVQFGLGGQPVVQTAGDQLQMVDRRKQRAVTIGTRGLLVQTTAYTRYEEFASWISLAVQALEATGEAAAMERVGLRYTDEIRIDGVNAPSDWAPYVAPELLGPLDVLESDQAITTQALVEYVLDSQERLVLRYGATRGWMVAPTGFLRTPINDDGPYFLLDLDSFWTASDEEVPPFDANEILRICEDLHAPVRRVFEASITDKLRDDVLRRHVDGD